ncbi:hypothetical protein [Streptomyces sp. NBC_00893]|uniref:hypothetical protein n=1 Tax=Streptomyces sp. NBC_00893 TaxID=2975862 RepID=UPI0022583774|nr:hypothetical protein [Streptomyces sp. NBC_00893]MCX4851096.1 hypothetical protein [Streptomyces sp. NBC_00893]
MELSAHEIGLVFTGWGLLVAAFSVFFAPRLQARYGTAHGIAATGQIPTSVGDHAVHRSVQACPGQ